MNRRSFLKVLGAAAPAVIIPGTVHKIFDPHPVYFDMGHGLGGNQLLTIAQVTKEALRVLENNLKLTNAVSRRYAGNIGDTVNVRLPHRWAGRLGPDPNALEYSLQYAQNELFEPKRMLVPKRRLIHLQENINRLRRQIEDRVAAMPATAVEVHVRALSSEDEPKARVLEGILREATRPVRT